jgi:hypothetical protein
LPEIYGLPKIEELQDESQVTKMVENSMKTTQVLDNFFSKYITKAALVFGSDLNDCGLKSD